MSINGIGMYSGYAAAYSYRKTERQDAGTNFGSYTETVQKSDMEDGAFVPHRSDGGDGEKAVGTTCGKDYSLTAYIPKDFDSENPVSSGEKVKEENLTTYYNGIPLEERKNIDKKYTDKETGISYYVADGKYPYITGEDAEKLKKLCAETGENYLKKMAEITGLIRHLDDGTVAYMYDNGTAIKSKDGRELWIDTSSLSYDVLSYLFQNAGGKGNYFSQKYWNDSIKSAIGNYLTTDR